MDTLLSKAINMEWDYIIIGTGMGGSTFGLSLAKAGKKVLFCEKGLALEKLSGTGSFPEINKKNNTTKEYQKFGRRFASIVDMSYKKPRVFTPFIGEGAGGSSLLYGMAMERGQPNDFSDWPIKYEDISHFYAEAESVFGVEASKTLHPKNKVVYEYLQSKGLHPYKLPLASQFRNDCTGCQGQLCQHHNKNHAGNRALKKALSFSQTLFLDECEILSLIETDKLVKEVLIKKNGQIFSLKSKNFVLAAGALETPRILFRSSSDKQKGGLANSSGQVGKNLMRHLIDLYVINSGPDNSIGMTKQIAFNDFYQIGGTKGGTVQSFGEMPPIKIMILDLLRDISFHSSIAKKVVQIFSPLFEFALKKTFQNSVVLASIVEDSPNQNNQVLNNPTQTSFIYQVNETDKKRLQIMREKIGQTLKSKIKMKIFSGEKNTLLAHACGTCKMGNNPTNSVVNNQCQSHDIKNLYIVDASVFPTSLGVNPALTIAANSLRIANLILKQELNKVEENGLSYQMAKASQELIEV